MSINVGDKRKVLNVTQSRFLSGWSYQPWSFTGHKTQFEGKNVSQPDNAEFDINESVEACMGKQL